MSEPFSAADLFSGVKPVEERHRLDPAALEAWMRRHVQGFAGPLTIAQFKGGQSNPTYKLTTPERSYVLRRKPFGPLLPSAHAIEREYRVTKALHEAGFPAPRPLALCEDADVVGAAFYVMDFVEGRVFWNAALPEASRDKRGAIYAAAIATLARLHSHDPVALGLVDYGKPGNYFARQVGRWTNQYTASAASPLLSMEKLIAWLPSSVPQQERNAIVHGDFRLDNMIFAPHEDRPIAVLDWELSTLGDPLADFTYFLMHWVLPADQRSFLGGLDHAALGIPTLDEAAAQYCALTDRNEIANLDWYLAFNLFRFAAILQGIAGRIRDGTASSSHASDYGERVGVFAQAAWLYAERAGAS